MDAILDDLNPAQREAVTHRGGPLLVAAGAGSGKTRVVTRRIAHVIREGEKPWAILAVTFTNKAAGEMAARVAALLGADARTSVATFHSTCARLLRRELSGIGRDSNFTIYDEDDVKKLIARLAKARGVDLKAMPAAALASAVSRLKNAGLDPGKAPAHSFRQRTIAEIYADYAEEMRRLNALDFDDLLLEAKQLLADHEAVREKYRARWRHVLVDEYQDTNVVQYDLVRLLAGSGERLCVVGDPDQSIYAWRGADVRNILEFERDFPGARIVRLEENYRSTRAILDAAGSLIEHNTQRIERGLRSVRGEGAKIELLAAIDGRHEADEVVRRIERCARKGMRYNAIAILYRTNAQSREFEEVLFRGSVPYALVGGVAFYERMEVKDVLAVLRLLVNPKDDVAFRRAITRPRRGLGASSLAKLDAAGRARGFSMLEAARDETMRGTLAPAARKGLAGFLEFLDGLAALGSYPVEPIVQAAYERSNYLNSFNEEERPDRGENLDALAEAASEYDEESPEGSLAGYLEEVALYADIDTWDEKADRVVLMTLHAAKGLEFEAVFLTGIEEGLLPHVRSFEEAHGLEEERRLAYVGMTRAKDFLMLSAASSRRRFGQESAQVPSRFFREIDAAAVADPDALSLLRGESARRRDLPGKPVWPRPKRKLRPAEPKVDSDGRYYEPDADFEPEFLDDAPALAVGERVMHAKFGQGVVMKVQGRGERATAHVRFSGFGLKKLALAYAKLEKLS